MSATPTHENSVATADAFDDALLRAILDASPECIKVLARDGTLRTMNAAGLAMVEAESIDDVVGKPMDQLVVPEHRRAFKSLTGSVFRGNEGTLEFEITGLKGTRRRLETHAAPLRDERGRVTLLIGVTRDVTEQRREQELLRESEEHHRALVEQLPAVTYIDLADDHCDTVYISPQLEAVLGVTPEEWTARDSHVWLDLVHPDDREPTLEALHRSVHWGAPLDVEYRMSARDGRLVWIRDRAHRIGEQSGAPRLYGVMMDITEHKEARAALAESEQRFRTLIETSEDIVSIQEIDGTFVYVSPSATRVLGYTPDEVLGQKRSVFTHEDDLAASEQAASETLTTGRAEAIPLRIRHKDGHWVWLEITRSALFDESGKAVSLIGLSRDITERKRAEEEAHESASLLELALDTGRMMVWHRDLRDGRLLGNTAEDFLRLTGIDLAGAEDPYSALLVVMHPEDRDRHAVAIATAIESGEPYEEEYRVIGPDGRTRWLATHGVAVRDKSGEPSRILSILRDVTRRREAADALAESEQRFRTLVETSPDMILVQEIDGSIMYASPSVSPILGYTSDELVDARTISFVHPVDVPAVKEVTRQALATGTSDVIAPRVRHKDGSWLSIETKTSALFDDSGKPVSLISAGRDVTERLLAQRELEESRELLLLALESAGMGMWSRDLRTLEATWTASIERLYGLEPGHHGGTNTHEDFLTFIHPDDRARLDSELRQPYAPGEQREFDFRTVWPDGSVHWLSARARAYADEKGKAVRLTGVAQDVTERKHVQQALEQALAIMEATYTTAPVALAFSDHELRFVRVNERLAEINGIPADEHIGRTLSELLPELAPEVEPHMRWVLDTGQPVDGVESAAATPSAPDTIRNWRVSYYPAFSEDGAVIGVATMIEDVTERTRRERELRESEARLRRALEAGRMISWEADLATDTSRITGGTPFAGWDFAAGGGGRETFLASVHPEDRRVVASAMEDAFAARGEYDVEFRLAREEGGDIWVAARGDVLRDDSGQPVRMVGVATDITGRKLAELELLALHETAIELLQVRDLDELLKEILRRASSLVGASYGYMYFLEEDGKTLTERLALGEAARYAGAKIRVGEGVGGRVVKQGKPFAVDDYRRWSRRSRQFDEANLRAVAGVPIRSGGKVVGALCVARPEAGRTFDPAQLDLLDRFGQLASLALESASLREELREHATDLERLVAERSAEAEAARLDAEQANAAKSGFLSRMSHDFRTPLNAILGFGQLLEKEESRSDVAESAGHIVAAGRHLLALVDEVLEISTIEAGGLSLSLEPVQLVDVIDEAAKVVQPLASERNIRVNVPGEGARDLAVVADRQRLLEVLLNLLANAVKYNRDGGTVDLACVPIPGDRVRVDIVDSGPGLADEDLAVIFLPFERLDGSAAEGTGLGLALVKLLVEAMGGGVGVESREGDGSRFFFELPAA